MPICFESLKKRKEFLLVRTSNDSVKTNFVIINYKNKIT